MTGLVWRLRVAAKRFAARHWLIIEFCKRCGRKQPLTWTADDALWGEIVDPSGGGVLCPECFDVRCRERGLWLRWVPVVESRDSGRVPEWPKGAAC